MLSAVCWNKAVTVYKPKIILKWYFGQINYIVKPKYSLSLRKKTDGVFAMAYNLVTLLIDCFSTFQKMWTPTTVLLCSKIIHLCFVGLPAPRQFILKDHQLPQPRTSLWSEVQNWPRRNRSQQINLSVWSPKKTTFSWRRRIFFWKTNACSKNLKIRKLSRSCWSLRKSTRDFWSRKLAKGLLKWRSLGMPLVEQKAFI